MKKCIVTGAAGFTGCNLVEGLVAAGDFVYEFVNSYQRGQLVLNQPNEEYVARNIVPIMDYIINTKETESLQIVDASNCNAKVVYGFDEFS